MRKTKLFLLSALLVSIFASFIPADVIPSPQSLMVTLTGYRNSDNELKCKLYYMTTLPEDASFIKKIHLKLEKPVDGTKKKVVSDIVIPNDWEAAKNVEGVVSYYTTRNILYIGIGEFDLLRKYECKISFIDADGNESRPAVYKK
tara:strand:- start:410 stop:844 length:435 start_codon:yes stop_codon:yes gene_type:complete